ncbi:MAG: hypothetical protein ABIZ18_09860 [Caldimonas sp.]
MKTTRPQPVNRKQVEQFLLSAQNKATAARKNLAIDAEAAYQIAYEAMLKGSLALMLSHGSRPRVQLGHHRAIIEFAQQHLDPHLASTFALFDRIRRKRNDAFYDIALITDLEAIEAVEAADKYLKLISVTIAARLK